MAVILNDFTLAGAKEQGAPGSGGVLPPKGNYEVRISETKNHTNSEGKVSVLCQLHFTGDYEGAECRIYLGTDLSVQGNRNAWLTALKSVGTDAGVLAQLADGRVYGGVNTGELMDGKTAYIFWEPKNVEAGKANDEKRFITKEAYLAGSSGHAQVAQTTATAPKVALSAVGPQAAAPAASFGGAAVGNGAAFGSVPQPATSSKALLGYLGQTR